MIDTIQGLSAAVLVFTLGVRYTITCGFFLMVFTTNKTLNIALKTIIFLNPTIVACTANYSTKHFPLLGYTKRNQMKHCSRLGIHVFLANYSQIDISNREYCRLIVSLPHEKGNYQISDIRDSLYYYFSLKIWTSIFVYLLIL